MRALVSVGLVLALCVPAMAIVINGTPYEIDCFVVPARDGSYNLDADYVESVGLEYLGDGLLVIGNAGDDDNGDYDDDDKVWMVKWDPAARNLTYVEGTDYSVRLVNDHADRHVMGIAIAPEGNSAGITPGALLRLAGNSSSSHHKLFIYEPGTSWPYYQGGDGTYDDFWYTPDQGRCMPTLVVLSNEIYTAADEVGNSRTRGLRKLIGYELKDFGAGPEKAMKLGDAVVWPEGLPVEDGYDQPLVRGGYQINDTDAIFVIGGTTSSEVGPGSHFDPSDGGPYEVVILRDPTGFDDGVQFTEILAEIDPLAIDPNEISITGVNPAGIGLANMLKDDLLKGLDGVAVANDLSDLGPVFFLINGNQDSSNGGSLAQVKLVYVLTPVPEPATLALLALGGLVALRRRK